jgi:protein SCO1
MRAQRDPDALALVAKFPGARMPALGLGEVDANDLISYLQAETNRLNHVQDAQDTTATAHHHHD